MSRAGSGLGLAATAAAAAVLYYAHRRSAETGRDIFTVLSRLPQELQESWEVWQVRLQEAVEVGKRAAAEREAEIEKGLAGEGFHEQPPTDYVL